MKIGLIGSGGREHAIAKALCKNQQGNSLFVFGSHLNPGIQKIVEGSFLGDMHDLQKIDDFFTANGVELVVVGPEVPLISGVSDQLRPKGFKVVGPTLNSLVMEASIQRER